MFGLLRDQPLSDEQDAQAIWAELIDLYAPTAVDAVHHLRMASWAASDPSSSTYGRLRTEFPAQVRTLLSRDRCPIEPLTVSSQPWIVYTEHGVAETAAGRAK